MSKVSIENVCKVYPGNIEAAKNVSIEIKDKEFLVLVGPSGCGKSTLLRMVAGLEEITSGTIKIGERVVNNVPPKDRDIAMVFQNYALYPHMSVYKNMAFGLKLRKFKKDEIDRRVRNASQILGIEELLDRKPKALSGGQRQRVAVGRAIVRQPKVFLFDEPLSNLDAKLRVEMRMEISKLHSRLQATMIYVTHDQVEAMTMGDRIVVMRDGLVQQVAEPIDLYENPVNRFVAEFIGSPPMNIFGGKLERNGSGLVFNAGDFQLNVPGRLDKTMERSVGKDITLGMRPEDITDEKHAGDFEDIAEVQAKVEVIEPMGSEAYLYMTTGESDFVARVNGHVHLDTDQELSIKFDMAKCHFFDENDLNFKTTSPS